MNFANIVRKHRAHFFRFACSSVCVLVVKIGLLWLFEGYTTPRIAYALTHIGIFSMSYLLHSIYTFRQSLSFQGLITFFKAVAVIKILDYVLFATLITYVPESLWLAVAVTVITFILRFLIMRSYYYKQHVEKSKLPPSA